MSRRWRWPSWLRPAFSLRSLLLAITLAACVFGLRFSIPSWKLDYWLGMRACDVSFSPDDSRIAVAFLFEPRFCVVNARNGMPLHWISDQSLVARMGPPKPQETCFLPKNTRVVFYSGETSRLSCCDLAAQRILNQVVITRPLLAFSSTSGRLVTTNMASESLDVWGATKSPSLLLHHDCAAGDDIATVVFNESGSELLVKSQKGFVWLPLDSTVAAEHFETPTTWHTSHCRLAISPNGQRFAACGFAGMCLYERGHAQPVRQWVNTGSRQVIWLPNSNIVAVLGSDDVIQLIDVETGACRRLNPVPRSRQLHVNKSGTRIVCVTTDGWSLLDATTGALLHTCAVPELVGYVLDPVVMSYDGQQIAAITDMKVMVWRRVFPEHWQPWLRGFYLALTSLAALALVVSLFFDRLRRRGSAVPATDQ